MNELQKKFETEKSQACWINSDIYPDGKIYTKPYTEWLEKEIQSLTEQLQKAKSCNKPCSPSDWMGKCKDNGCNNDGIDLDKFRDLEKEFS